MIEALFGYNDWDYQEVGEREQHGDFDAGPDVPGFMVPQDGNAAECVLCFCRPCITDNINKQLWWEDDPQPAHERNRGVRKGIYKRFWAMFFHRQVWQDARYLANKSAAWEQDRNRIHHVWGGGRLHKRLFVFGLWSGVGTPIRQLCTICVIDGDRFIHIAEFGTFGPYCWTTCIP